jgi:hypothetical protein
VFEWLSGWSCASVVEWVRLLGCVGGWVHSPTPSTTYPPTHHLPTQLPTEPPTQPLNHPVSNILSATGLKTMEDKAIGHGVWFDPVVGQGGYDMVQVTVPDSNLPTKIFLRFVQATRGKKHDLKFRFMLAFIAALVTLGFEMVGVDVVILVPAGECGAFTLGNVYSNNQFSEASGNTRKKIDVRVAGMHRS